MGNLCQEVLAYEKGRILPLCFSKLRVFNKKLLSLFSSDWFCFWLKQRKHREFLGRLKNKTIFERQKIKIF